MTNARTHSLTHSLTRRADFPADPIHAQVCMGKITVKAAQNAVKHILKEMLFSVKEAQNRPSPDFTLYEEEGGTFSPFPHTHPVPSWTSPIRFRLLSILSFYAGRIYSGKRRASM